MAATQSELMTRIKRAIDTVRPHLHADGGDVEIVELQPGGVLVVKFTGACRSCRMMDSTLFAGIHAAVTSTVPEVVKVVAAPA